MIWRGILSDETNFVEKFGEHLENVLQNIFVISPFIVTAYFWGGRRGLCSRNHENCFATRKNLPNQIDERRDWSKQQPIGQSYLV